MRKNRVGSKGAVLLIFFVVVVGRLGERRGRGGFELFCIYKGLEGERNRLVLLEVRESQTQKWLLVLLRQRFDSNS